MTSPSILVRCTLLASLLGLASCSNLAVEPPSYLGVTISPRPASVPVGTSVILTGVVSNNLSIPQWTILDAADAGNPGTLTPVPGDPDEIEYTAPATPPIYSPALVIQGSVTVGASVTDPGGTSIPTVSDSITFAVTAPEVSLSLAPLTATVPLGGTQQFVGYAVGSVNNGLTWQINGVTGGSSATGTINSAGLYTAPAALPMSGNTLTLTIISQADPTKSQSAAITLQ